MHRRALPLVAALAAALSGCFVFDESLYLNAQDAGAGDGGGDLDAGFSLAGTAAEVCGMSAPLLEFTGDEAENLAFNIDTRGRVDDVSEVTGCTGARQDGPDLFLSIDMEPTDRWHFHIRVASDQGDGDPAIYVLSGCDDRGCSDGDGLDVCESNSDEHFSYRPERAERVTVAFDSARAPGNDGGFAGSVEAYRTVCGDGQQTHSEGCDDGNDVDDDGCSNECRVNLSGSAVREVEVNDDPFGANHLRPTGDTVQVSGEFNSTCEVDFFLLEVTEAGTSLDARLVQSDGSACTDVFVGTGLELWDESPVSQRPERVQVGSVAADAFCPTLSRTELQPGTYWLRVLNVLSDPRAATLGYRLDVTLTPPAAP